MPPRTVAKVAPSVSPTAPAPPAIASPTLAPQGNVAFNDFVAIRNTFFFYSGNFLFFLNLATSAIMATFRGASLHCRINAITGVCKAPQMGIEDAPSHAAAAVDTIMDDQPAASLAIHLKEFNSQGPSTAGGNSSSHGEKSTQIEEELS